MKFTVKYISDSDLAEAVRVEQETMGNYTYLKDAYELYKHTPGAMVGICDGEHMAGIGRFTVLPDNTGWLECLRVSPEYQHMGAGKMIYEEYLKLAEKYHCTSMAMYTGMKNIKSSSLAEKYGLYTVQVFHGFHIPAEMCACTPFRRLTPDEAEVLMQYKEKYHDYLSVSRTFYHFNKENIRSFAAEGMVYGDEESGSLVIAGARFQHYKTLHAALMEGNTEKCLSFLKTLAYIQGIHDITFTIASPCSLEDVLKEYGASMDSAEIIVKEKKF